jgi:RNA polymerase sigma-70 factor (ECF subfamily)
MPERDWLAERFEENRSHLRTVAYRMLGSASEADDAVQECWFRLSRSGASGVDNLDGWLTTVVARICLDMLRARKSRREEQLGEELPETIASHDDGLDPERQALLADAVGPALLVVLETLAPAERVAFVLHDVFGVSFEEIAPIVERTPVAARQLASRARRRVQGGSTVPDGNLSHQRKIVDAFLAAARGGEFDALLALLDPNVVLRSDAAFKHLGGVKELFGAEVVAGRFSGGQGQQPALVNGIPGLVWAPGGQPRAVFSFTIAHGKIVGIDMISNRERLRELDVVILAE